VIGATQRKAWLQGEKKRVNADNAVFRPSLTASPY
jgi:hypothetical protein